MKRTSPLWCCCAVLMLSACADGGGPDPMTPDAGAPDGGTSTDTLSVSGTLVDLEGNPVANASILVLGSTAPSVSDTSGAFSLTGVKTPYDVVVRASGSRVATVYKGLSRQAIALTLLDPRQLTHRGTLEGRISGDDATHYPLVLFASPEVREGPRSLSINSTDSEHTYSAQVEWSGPAVTTGTLYSLQTVRASLGDIPTRYAGFGWRENVSLASGTTVSGQDITMNPVANSTFSGSFTLASGYILQDKQLRLTLPPDSRLRLFSERSSGTAFSYAVPVIPQASLSFVVTALRQGAYTSAFRTGFSPGTTGLTLALPDAPHPLSPANQTTNVTRATPLSWTAYPEGVYLLRVKSSNPAGTPYTVYVVTSEQSALIPDLSGIGMALPGNTPFSWDISGMAPLASVDAAVTGPRVSELARHRTDGSIGYSESRAFTTASSP